MKNKQKTIQRLLPSLPTGGRKTARNNLLFCSKLEKPHSPYRTDCDTSKSGLSRGKLLWRWQRNVSWDRKFVRIASTKILSPCSRNLQRLEVIQFWKEKNGMLFNNRTPARRHMGLFIKKCWRPYYQNREKNERERFSKNTPTEFTMKHKIGDINTHFEQNNSSDDVLLFVPTIVQ